jgi:hypothetical protein
VWLEILGMTAPLELLEQLASQGRRVQQAQTALVVQLVQPEQWECLAQLAPPELLGLTELQEQQE